MVTSIPPGGSRSASAPIPGATTPVTTDTVAAGPVASHAASSGAGSSGAQAADRPGPSVDDLMAQLAAARREVGQVTLASQVVRAQSELEGLMQAVRLAQASGDSQHALALASEAGRIGRDLARFGAEHGNSVGGDVNAIQGELAATLRISRQVGAVASGGDPEQVTEQMAGAPPTDIKA